MQSPRSQSPGPKDAQNQTDISGSQKSLFLKLWIESGAAGSRSRLVSAVEADCLPVSVQVSHMFLLNIISELSSALKTVNPRDVCTCPGNQRNNVELL